MKKINTILSIALIFLFSVSEAQIIEQFPTSLKIKKRAELKFLKTTEDGKTIVVREALQKNTTFDRERYYIEIFDKDKNLINQKSFKHIPFDDLWVRNDSILLLYGQKKYIQSNNTRGYYIGSTAKSISIMGYASSIQNLDFNEKSFYKVKGGNNLKLSPFFFTHVKNNINYKIKSSKNDKYLAVIFHGGSKTKISSIGKNYSFSESIFLNKANKIYSSLYQVLILNKKTQKLLYTHDFVLNHGTNSVEIEEIEINEFDGSLCFEEREKVKSKMFSNTTIVTKNFIKVTNNQLARINLGQINNKHHLTGYKLTFYKDKTYMVGNYASDLKRQKCIGFFKIELDHDLRPINTNFLPFSREFISDRENILKKQNKFKTNALEFNKLRCLDLFMDSEGDCVINTVEFPHVDNYNTKAPGHRIKVSLINSLRASIYFVNSCKISFNNELKWSRSIFIGGTKNAESTESFASSYQNGKNYLIFNQTENNLHYIIKDFKTRSEIKDFNNDLYIFEIDQTGNIKYSNPFKYTKGLNRLIKYYIPEKENSIDVYFDSKEGKLRSLSKMSF